MGAIELLSLSLIMFIGALIPSSSVLLVIARSLSHDIRNGVLVSLGIVCGDVIFILLAILGLSVVAETMGWLFVAIKYVGATYLIWLGYGLLTSKPKAINVERRNHKGNLLASFLSGLFLTLGDIKAIFFFISVLPAIVNPGDLAFIDVLVIVLLDIFIVGGVKIFYAVSAKKVAVYSKNNRWEVTTKRIAGGLMLGTGSYILVKT